MLRMERSAGLLNLNVIEGDVREELTRLKEFISAKERSAAYSLKRNQSLHARYIYGFIFLKTNLLAWFIRDYGHNLLSVLRYIPVCARKGNNCFHDGGVLRVSFGCFIYFLSMFFTTFRAKKLNGARNSWHSRWWTLKFVFYLISMMVVFFIPTDLIELYGEIARIGAGIFLILQLISVIHFLAWCNSYLMPDSHCKHWYKCDFLGLFLSTIFCIATFCGIVLMYFMYAPDTSCTLNIFLITWTAILVTVMMVVSLHSKINTGLLSSAIMGSYIVFLCWSAIQSEPPIGKCRTRKAVSENVDWTTILSFLIAVCAIVMATFSTGIDSRSFQFRKDTIQLEDDIPYEYDLFHLILSIGAMHFAMLYINWELDHPIRKWSIDVGWVSTLVKVINEWFAASIYLWKLISPVLMSDEVLDREEPVQHVNGSV